MVLTGLTVLSSLTNATRSVVKMLEKYSSCICNKFFTEIGPNLAKDIYPSLVTFETYLKRFHKNQKENDLTINELKEAFFSLKTNKIPGYDDINFNVIRQCF